MSAFIANAQRDRIHPFLSNVAEIRRRARQHIEEGGANAGHATDREAVLRLLNAALATELVCVLRYQRYAVMDSATVADTVKNEFMKRAQDEQSHANQIAARIVELGGAQNVVVYVSNAAQMLNANQIGTGGVFRFHGFLFNDNGTLRMVCDEVLDGVAD